MSGIDAGLYVYGVGDGDNDNNSNVDRFDLHIKADKQAAKIYFFGS